MADSSPQSGQRLSVLLVLAQATGGIGRHVRTLAEQLPARGIEVAVCGPAESIATLGLDRVGVRVVTAPLGGPGPVALLESRRSLRKAADGIDLVHAHGLRAGAACVGFLSGRPLIVTWHNAPLGGRLWQRGHGALSRYVARSTDLTLAASDDLAAAARAAGAEAVRTTFVTAPALPPATRSPAAVRAELGIGDRPLILAVGRLQRQKRFDVLVDAAGGWVDDATAPVVVIAGEGPERAALAARVTAAQADVRLLGAREDIPDLLAAADVVALPSEWEARSLVAQEALRAGVPLVTTAVGGLASLVGAAAELVPVGDPAALRAALTGVLGDPGRREQLITAGHSQAQTWPDEATALDELAATYLDLNRRARHL